VLDLRGHVGPQGGPPPHIQHREHEWTYVLDGEFEFLKGAEAIRAGVGSLIHVPNGNLHTHKNVGEGAGRPLVGQTPGGLLEGFFEELGEEATDTETSPAMDDPPDVARITALAASYGIEILPPAT
jgi:hypothetical protein